MEKPDKGKRRADEDFSDSSQKKVKRDYSSEEEDKWVGLDEALRESRNTNRNVEQRGESSRQPNIQSSSHWEKSISQEEQIASESEARKKQPFVESTNQSHEQDSSIDPNTNVTNQKDLDPDKLFERASQFSESESSDSYKTYGSEKGIDTDDETDAFSDGIDGQVRKMMGVWQTLETSEIGDYRRANFLHGDYYHKLLKKQSRYAECMNDPTKTISFRRWYKGKHVAVSEFLNDTQRERELDEELFRWEQQQTDPGLGKSETPSTPSNNNDNHDDDNHDDDNHDDDDDGSSGNSNIGSSPSGPSDPGAEAGPESSGGNFNAKVMYVFTYLGYICDIIIDILFQIPM